MTKIAERIKELREDKKLTKTELGLKIGVSDVAIGYWEHGRSEPNASNIVALADFFEVSADYLLGRIEF